MTTPDPRRLSRQVLLDRCRAGLLPAEMLDTRDREHLLYDLWRDGLTDTAIAAHTYLSTYTVARIRTRLGLRPRLHWEHNRAPTGVAW